MLTVLLCLLCVAVICDLRTKRIPNVLVVAGVGAGLAFAVADGGWYAALMALACALAGMAVFIPFFAFRLVGAGDVKLFGVVALFVGFDQLFEVLLLTLMAGGLIGLLAVLASRRMGGLIGNLKMFYLSTALGLRTGGLAIEQIAGQSALRVPYSLAIAAGVLLSLWVT